MTTFLLPLAWKWDAPGVRMAQDLGLAVTWGWTTMDLSISRLTDWTQAEDHIKRVWRWGCVCSLCSKFLFEACSVIQTYVIPPLLFWETWSQVFPQSKRNIKTKEAGCLHWEALKQVLLMDAMCSLDLGLSPALGRGHASCLRTADKSHCLINLICFQGGGGNP